MRWSAWIPSIHGMLCRWLSTISGTAKDSVLEVGTGTGGFSQKVVAHCHEFTGLEHDKAAYETTCQRLEGRGRLVQGDAQLMPFPDRSFSVIVCLEVLEHLENYRRAVAEIHRCLQPGGHVIVSVTYRRRGGPNPGNRFHIYEPGERELIRCFRRHFSQVDALYQYFEETPWVSCARVLHLRSVLGLASIYGNLTLGTAESLAKLRIGSKPGGLKLNLLLLARGPRPEPLG